MEVALIQLDGPPRWTAPFLIGSSPQPAPQSHNATYQETTKPWLLYLIARSTYGPHSHSTLVFFHVCWKYLCSFFFWKVSHFRMIFCFLGLTTIRCDWNLRICAAVKPYTRCTRCVATALPGRTRRPRLCRDHPRLSDQFRPLGVGHLFIYNNHFNALSDVAARTALGSKFAAVTCISQLAAGEIQVTRGQ